MEAFKFDVTALPADALEAQRRVREFLAAERAAGSYPAHVSSWNRHDAAFSRRAGKAGLIGVGFPKEYGGQGWSFLARHVISREMLANGAPCFAHWIAERQSGPQILRHGSERAKKLILPKICAGECTFGIGMSEPDSGSDLAAVRTRAVRRGEDWVINGSKIWTSNAQHANYLIALVRTGEPEGKNRHVGLTQFIVDMAQPGVTVRPIYNLAGEHEFNEIYFRDHVVPDDLRVGAEGSGWEMVTGELAFERSGPDRFLSDYRLFVELIERVGKNPEGRHAIEIGRLVAQLSALMRMSASIAGMLEAGRSPQVEAALVKDVGTVFERELPEIARKLAAVQPSVQDEGEHYGEALSHVVLSSPSYTLRGGTREILRGVIARGLGLR